MMKLNTHKQHMTKEKGGGKEEEESTQRVTFHAFRVSSLSRERQETK